MRHWSDIKPFAVRMMRDVERKNLMLVAAGLAYYFLMSLFPALVLLAAGAAYLPHQNGSDGFTSFLAHVVPPQGLSILQDLLASISPHRSGLLSFGIVTALWLASVGGQAIIESLDLVYDVRVPRPIWVNRMLACVLTFGVGVLMLLGVGLTLIGPTIESILSKIVPVQSLWLRAWPYIQWCVAALSIFAALELLYWLAPNVDRTRRMTLPGAIVATVGWMALSWGLGFYFQRFGGLKLYRFYGILASPVAFMVWLYWCAAVLLMGAQINAILRDYRQPPRPRAQAA
jgi:membrane protein